MITDAAIEYRIDAMAAALGCDGPEFYEAYDALRQDAWVSLTLEAAGAPPRAYAIPVPVADAIMLTPTVCVHEVQAVSEPMAWVEAVRAHEAKTCLDRAPGQEDG